jgi:hypothetical protein
MTSEYTYQELLILKNAREQEVLNFQNEKIQEIHLYNKYWQSLPRWKKILYFIFQFFSDRYYKSLRTEKEVKTQMPFIFGHSLIASTDEYGNYLMFKLNQWMPLPGKTANLNEDEVKLFTTPFKGELFWFTKNNALPVSLLEDDLF